MSLRILALTNLYPNPWQPGRAPFNRQLFRELARVCPLRVITPIAWTDELRARRRSGATLTERRVSCDGITIDHPRFLFPPRIMRAWHGHFFLRSVRAAFARAIEEFQPDIVYGSWAYPDGWAAVHLGHSAKLPVAIKVHGSDIYLLDRYPARLRRTREVVARADRLIAPSKDLAQRVVELGADPSRVNVIYNGVDDRLFYPGPQPDARRRLNLPSDTPIILFVGNLVPLKGISSLIDACMRLAGDRIDFSCHLIGEGPMMRHLEHQIRARGLSERVILHGAKSHEELPDWYRASDVFVLPSHSEGVPNVLLEAMACGTWFVASNVGGIPEIAESGRGRLVPPGDVASLDMAIRDALTGAPRGMPLSSAPSRSFAETGAELAGVLEQVAGLRESRDRSFVGHAGVAGVE